MMSVQFLHELLEGRAGRSLVYVSAHASLDSWPKVGFLGGLFFGSQGIWQQSFLLYADLVP